MVIDTVPAVTGTQLGYARVSTAHQSLDQQLTLTEVGVDATRVYTDKLSAPLPANNGPALPPFWTTPARATSSWWLASTAWAAMLRRS